MDPIHEISDEDFVPFLHDLGVETYKKSFEWMLNGPDFAGVLRWIYKNLDHNNALSAREEYRSTELEKRGCLLSPAKLSSSISSIKDQYPGICLPGDQDSRENVELDVQMQRERLNVLEKQEMTVQDLINENDRMKEKLTLEQVSLNAALLCLEERPLADECLELANELDSITDEAIAAIDGKLDVYTNCRNVKETANRFYKFAPLESYRQSQALFRSHFKLYMSKNLVNKQNFITDEELRSTLLEAMNVEERLGAAVFAYIDSKAELCGQQAKQALVSSYRDVHRSQVTSIVLETQSALELLEQEENILLQEMEHGVKQLVKCRTSLAVNAAAAAAVTVKQQMLSSLSSLAGAWQHAISLDRLLYQCLRHELRTVEEFVSYATQLSQYVTADNSSISDRIAAMSEICADHESREKRQSSKLIELLCTTLGAPSSSDASIVVKLHKEMQDNVKELRSCAEDGWRKREEGLEQMKNSSKPLSRYIWDGCTKQPNCWDRTVAALSHSLQHEMNDVDKRVLEASSLFTSVKKGDKKNLRKLWQWFLTDPSRLQSAMKNARCF